MCAQCSDRRLLISPRCPSLCGQASVDTPVWRVTIVQPPAPWQERLLCVVAASLMISQLHRCTLLNGWPSEGAGAPAARPGAGAEGELSGARGDLSITGSGCSLAPKPSMTAAKERGGGRRKREENNPRIKDEVSPPTFLLTQQKIHTKELDSSPGDQEPKPAALTWRSPKGPNDPPNAPAALITTSV